MEQSEDTGATRCRWSQDVKKYSFLDIHNSAKNDFCQPRLEVDNFFILSMSIIRPLLTGSRWGKVRWCKKRNPRRRTRVELPEASSRNPSRNLANSFAPASKARCCVFGHWCCRLVYRLYSSESPSPSPRMEQSSVPPIRRIYRGY